MAMAEASDEGRGVDVTTSLPAGLPGRPSDGHKGTFGTVIVVAGSATMPGAAAMAARAALRGGAGLVKVAGDQGLLDRVLAIEPSATGLLIEDAGDGRAWLEGLRSADPDGRAVLAVGPGLGSMADTLLPGLINDARAAVIDADGLTALAVSGRRLRRRGPTVLTPHPGEFRRLALAVQLRLDPTDEDQRPEAARRLAEAHEAVVALKGMGTIVSDGRRAYRNTTGNAAMATAGTGDVLTGLTAALLAGGMSAYDAACVAVHVHGAAGDLWTSEHGDRGMLARELADRIPDVCRRMSSGGDAGHAAQADHAGGAGSSVGSIGSSSVGRESA